MIGATDDEHFMRMALREAEHAFGEDEIPVGCVIVCREQVIARGYNLTERLNDVTAHAEMQASTDRGTAIRAQAEADADADKIRSLALRVRAEIEAEALQMMNTAHNMLSPEARMSALRMRLVEKAEGIIRESVKPMERIEGIKILHVDGLGGSGGGGGDHLNGLSGNNNFADGIVNSALRFRAQAPLVDQLLREIGIEGGDIQRLVGSASGATAALPPAAPKAKE